MPFTLTEWAELAAIVSAASDFVTFGRESYESYYQKRLESPLTQERGVALQKAFSTYEDSELESIKSRLLDCRNRFIKEGSGSNRTVCICSVLTDVKEGNGGIIPDEEWEKIYNHLNCES